MKHLLTFSRVLLILCRVSVLGTLMSFWSLHPISQSMHILYAPMARLSLWLYMASLFLLPIAAAAGLVIALIRKAWRMTALYIALIPLWLYAVAVVGNAV